MVLGASPRARGEKLSLKAINWIIENQLGRRNLHPDQASYLRGKRYNGEKQQGKRTDLDTSNQNDKKSQTHEHLATEYKVGPATIVRDGQYAAAVDKLATPEGSTYV
ncbi:MAG TPA: hypothetical protein PK708_05190 [Candidatus Competibacter sp.]|nr:hypothetical protein [Candidatus Competibacter sp.]